MAMRSVGFQLVTAGKAQVRNDFAEVKADGVASVTAIGLAAETAASKAAKAVDDLTDRQIASYRRQANAAKLAAAGAANQDAFNAALATPTSQQFATVNTDRSTGSARRSASVFEEADRRDAQAAADAAEANRLAARAADERAAIVTKLRAAIDPLWAAEQRLAAELAEVAIAQQAGVLTTDQLSEAQARARARFDDTRRSLDGTARSEADASAGAARLLAEINPVAVAQERLNRELVDYQDWARRGLLATDELADAQARARARFEETRLSVDADAAALARWTVEANDAKVAAAMDARRGGFDTAVANNGSGSQFATVDLDRSTGAARRSADAFEDRFRAEEAATAAALKLRAAIDPVWAAEQRLATELAEVDLAQKAGILSTNGLATAQAAARKRFDDTTDAIKRQSGAGGGLSKNQKQTLLYTASDIVGSSANGVHPAQLLIQQGPQVLQAFAAEEGGLLKLRALIGPVSLGLTGLAALTIAGTAAWYDYANALDKLNALGQGSAGVIGATGVELEAAAEAAARSGTISVGAAREIETEYVKLGGIGKDVLGGLTALTVDFAAATGQDTKAALQQLGAAFSDPVKGAEDLTVRYGYLTQAQIEHIGDLVEQNDLYGAQQALLLGLQKPLEGAADHVNGLARAWRYVTNEASDAWTAMGRAIDRALGGGTAIEKLADLQQRRALLLASNANGAVAAIDQEIAAVRKAAAAEKTRDDGKAARSRGVSTMRNVDAITGDNGRSDLKTKLGAVNALLADNGKAAGLTAEQLERARTAQDMLSHAVTTYLPEGKKAVMLAEIDAKIAGTKNAARKGELVAERSRIEQSGKLVTSAQAAAEAIAKGDKATFAATGHGNRHAQSLARQAQSMEVSAAAALDVADAYLKSSAAGVTAEARRKAATDATRKGIDVESQARRQLALQAAEDVAAGAKSVAGMRDATDARVKVNAAIADGSIGVAQMNQALNDESALRPLIALRDTAEGEAKAKLTTVIDAYTDALKRSHAEEAHSGAIKSISDSADRLDELKSSITDMSRSPLDQMLNAAKRAAVREADDNEYVGTDRTTFIDTKVAEARATYAQSQASYILDTLRGQKDSIALSERDLQLAGANDNTRDAELDKLRLALQIRRQFPDMAAADVAQILSGVDAQQAVNEKLKVTAAALGEVRGYGNQFVDEVLSEDTWSSWGNAGKTVLSSLKSEFIKLALLNPLKNLINGNSNLPTLTSAFGNIAGLFGGKGASVSASRIGPPGNATGTESFAGGLTYVHENGGEIMDLPNKTRIYPAAESRRMMQAANDAGGGGRMRVDIGLNSELLTATVSGIADQRVGAAAPGIAAGGAQLGKMEMSKARRRQLGRR